VLRCPLTCAVNGQQHSSSCFVCNSQYHGLVQKARLRRQPAGSHEPASCPSPSGIRHPPFPPF
jgi:hypothetical protein